MGHLLSLEEAVARYGPVKDGIWPNAYQWCERVRIPAAVADMWVNTLTKGPTTGIYCNKDMAGALLAAVDNVANRGLLRELRTFDGCFHVRDVRGIPGKVSTHAYALAIDINAGTNRLGTAGDLSAALAACFTDVGFIHGRTFKRQDPMHLQLALW